MEKKRSVGVTVSAVILITTSILNGLFIFSYYFHRLGSFIRQHIGQLGWIYPAIDDTGVGILFIFLFFLFCLISGIGILKLKNWARVLFILGILIMIFFGLLLFYWVNPLKMLPEFILPSLFYYFIYFLPLVISLYFFARPKVKEQFR